MNKIKTIYKPWGKEVWIELNDKYCYKHIYLNKGCRTSFQYHTKKQETCYIVSGQAELWLENEKGEIEKTIVGPGDSYNVAPPLKHRLVATSNLFFHEVSTPEVDDTIRIQDDFKRPDGKIKHEHFKPALCILAAGLGNRLGNFTQHINKGLLPLEDKAIISHIIHKTDKDVEIVMAVGYKSKLIKEYCQIAHKDRTFIFVDVENYNGKGSGTATSIRECKLFLQRPFYLTTVDTIIQDEWPSLNYNWLGIYPTQLPELYCTVDKSDSNEILHVKNKSKEGYDYAFVGLASIYDYKTFWNNLDVDTLEVIDAFLNIENYKQFNAEQLEWYDTGTLDNYLHTSRNILNNSLILPKNMSDEFFYVINNNVIKLFANNDYVTERMKRAEILGNLVPKITYRTDNIYAYKWIDGQNLYEEDNIKTWSSFLDFVDNSLLPHIINTDITELCEKFYFDKTHGRIEQYLSNRKESYRQEHIINGKTIPCINDLINNLNKKELVNGLATPMFHGDMNFSNLIYDGNFYFIDWRHNFAGCTDYGDIYYDFAKFNSGLYMPFHNVHNDKDFELKIVNGCVNYNYLVNDNLRKFIPMYHQWLITNKFDLQKVETLTGLVYLNMAPLHDFKTGDLLFFKGKEMLYNANS